MSRNQRALNLMLPSVDSYQLYRHPQTATLVFHRLPCSIGEMPRKRRGPHPPRRTTGTDVPAPPRSRRRRISRCSTMMLGVTTKPAIRRLARRGGVKRLSLFMYEETRGCLYTYMKTLLRNTVLHTEHDYRTTVRAEDVRRALRWSGGAYYG
ncbi:hypothetical protein FB451DRAFT_1281143 [Mycena latifolia]|nr:hypothetical protein FB451DRAFT_1281143 [Mycena latifolia]